MPEITQPGTYTASLAFGTDTPYPVAPVAVSLTVKPPATWGKITGTVTGPAGPLAGATVQINTWATHYTLKTDTNGTTRSGSTSATTRCSSSSPRTATSRRSPR